LSATADAALPSAADSAGPQPAPTAGAPATAAPLLARAAAELVGTAALVAVVVGSGIQATALTHDVALQLLANSTATVLGLGVLITLLGPVSGAHFNPAVTLAGWWTGRRLGSGVTLRDAAVYIPAQIAGAVLGAVLADAMFAEPLVSFSTHDRSAGHLLLGEIVATAGLILLVFGLARTDLLRYAPAAVAAYIGAAYWFTSSTSFANPAVTVGRTFTDTFAGIAPGSLPGFVAAQLLGTVVGLALTALLFTPGRRTDGPPQS
jgi:glycerol uptake facilitator-like aquaporin